MAAVFDSLINRVFMWSAERSALGIIQRAILKRLIADAGGRISLTADQLEAADVSLNMEWQTSGDGEAVHVFVSAADDDEPGAPLTSGGPANAAA